MRRIHSFTLVEILVVIAIIGILAGLIFPALNGARATSQTTTCLNNKRNLAQITNVYATDHNREVIFSFANDQPYSLLFRGYTLSAYDLDVLPTGRVYMSFPTMRCPLAKIRGTKGKEEDPEQQVSAMFDVEGWLDSDINGKKGKERYGDFRIEKKIKSGSQNVEAVVYAVRQMRSTSTLPLFTDAFEKTGGSSRVNPLSKATWKFDEKGSNGSNGVISLIHQDKVPVSYADGHADLQEKNGLGTLGLNNFYDGAFKSVKAKK